MSIKSITLGGGCFWCVEAVFDRLQGVQDVVSGYCNGHTPNPSYEAVCTGQTGHVEVVRLRYDSGVISLEEVLQVFFVIHDPTTLNRQGNDEGTQYRSGIYFEDEADRVVIDKVLSDLKTEKAYVSPITTEVLPLKNFTQAEDYHQDYFLNHPNQGYCAYVVAPKVAKFSKTFAARLKP